MLTNLKISPPILTRNELERLEERAHDCSAESATLGHVMAANRVTAEFNADLCRTVDEAISEVKSRLSDLEAKSSSVEHILDLSARTKRLEDSLIEGLKREHALKEQIAALSGKIVEHERRLDGNKRHLDNLQNTMRQNKP